MLKYFVHLVKSSSKSISPVAASRGFHLRRICTMPSCRTMHTESSVDLNMYDSTQVKLMEEMCILVDEEDRVRGSASKRDCHQNSNMSDGKMLHRAFSVFLFNSENKLLLQQRSDEKITFPAYFTNTCCSHPLHRASELEEENQMGVKTAAQRKLGHELGILPEQVPLEKFDFLTRILYRAKSDEKWGEHELDYILFIKQDVDLNVNENEVKSHQYVSPQELQDFLAKAESNGHLVTPWFKLIAESFLWKWWDHLDDLDSVKDTKTIHNMVK